MRNITKIISIWLVLVSGISFAETLGEKADNGSLEEITSIDQAIQLLGTLNDGDRYHAVMDLQGWNKADKNYMASVTPLSVDDIDKLMPIDQGYRNHVITKFTDNDRLKGDLTIDQALQLLGTLNGSDRYSALKYLLGHNKAKKNYIQAPISAADANQLMQNMTYRHSMIGLLAPSLENELSVKGANLLLGSLTGSRDEAIKALADHGNLRQDGYKATQVNTILADSVNGDRYSALKYLLGRNKAKKNYIQAPISAADANQLMQNMTYRHSMIGLMTDNDIIIDHLNYSDANKVIGKLDGNYRVNAFKDLSGDNKLKKNYLVETLTIINGVPFPQGPISFADKVIDYKPGTGVESPHDDMNVAVGLPGNTGNFCDASVCNEVSLGVHGTIITQFIDNYLTTSGDDSLDLWIFETGNAVEATKVDVSVNGKDWIDVGSVEGATSGVDIDAFKDNGIVEDIKYRYVRLTDLKGESSRPYQGADIDAVGAISAATKEIRDLVKTIEENNFVDFDIAFEGNHWRLQDDIKPELDKLGEVLSAHAFSKGSFELVGHVAGKGGMHKVCIDSQHKVVNNSRFAMECWDTDNAWAQTLSERRAQSVRDYLLKNFTIPAGRIKAYGVGHSQHKFNNPDDAGNRRVEVKYTKQ